MSESRWRKNATGARKTVGPGIVIGAIPDGVEIADITPDSVRLLLPEPPEPVRYLDEVVFVEDSPEGVKVLGQMDAAEAERALGPLPGESWTFDEDGNPCTL